MTLRTYFVLFILSSLAYVSAGTSPSCTRQLEKLGANPFGPGFPQSWNVPFTGVKDFLGDAIQASGHDPASYEFGTFREREGGEVYISASCYEEFMFVPAGLRSLLVIDVQKLREVANLEVLGFPRKIHGVTDEVVALTLSQSVADAGDGSAIVNIERDKVLFASSPNRYGSTVPALVVPSEGVLIEDSYATVERVYRSLSYHKLVTPLTARKQAPVCAVNVPNGFSVLLALEYTVTNRGIVARGERANGTEASKLLTDCRELARKLKE